MRIDWITDHRDLAAIRTLLGGAVGGNFVSSRIKEQHRPRIRAHVSNVPKSGASCWAAYSQLNKGRVPTAASPASSGANRSVPLLMNASQKR